MNFVMSACLSVSIKLLGYNWTDFSQNLIFECFSKNLRTDFKIYQNLKRKKDTFRKTYTVWQKSNETYFLLNMNFILFTNQGYPLRSSSLGQLHSDGGVDSIVCSSAGRLLLEYLSARQLRSSGYYPKYQNGALSSVS